MFVESSRIPRNSMTCTGMKVDFFRFIRNPSLSRMYFRVRMSSQAPLKVLFIMNMSSK